jgi:hypothetical protein
MASHVHCYVICRAEIEDLIPRSRVFAASRRMRTGIVRRRAVGAPHQEG